MWDNRFLWSGEIPLSWPGLGPVALQRFEERDANNNFPDSVDPSHVWESNINWATTSALNEPGRHGKDLAFNRINPGSEQERVTLPYFPGLWPSSGRLLVGLWVQQNYTMTFNPLLSTRGGSNPLIYLSTYTNGRFRHGVYDGSGSSVLDQYEDPAWVGSTDHVWLGQYVDMDAQTSQLVSVERSTGRYFIGPARALSGAPNAACVRDLDVFSLQTAGYYTGGFADEVLVAHPSASFDLSGFVEALARGVWSRGADVAAVGNLAVTDGAVTAGEDYTLVLGAEQVSWTEAPEPSVAGAIPFWSDDDGETWSTGALPATFAGLLRWDVPLTAGDTFTGLDLLPPSPTLAPIAAQSVEQQGEVDIPLTATYHGAPEWTVAAPGIAATIADDVLTLAPGWAAGEITVTVTLRDEYDRIASRSFVLTVSPAPWSPPPPPQYPHTPIVMWDGDGPSEAIIDPLSAEVVKENNGEHTLEFKLPASHRKVGAVQSERRVELAGERYRVRRVTTSREGRAPAVRAYCEAEFYDLAYAGQVPASDYLQTTAGAAMEEALEGTGWTIGAVTVTTRRTYSAEQASPLARLRAIQRNHGGDLLFDSAAKTVSLVVQSGRDNGVAFLYGRGLSGSKRVEDTTSLVTRITARNADGVTIADVNGGSPYVEDYTWTSEVREAVYDFASGTSPYTMLAMAQATLAARSKPSFSYEFTVADLSHITGQEVDAFDVGDIVTVIDAELGIRETQRIVKVRHDVARPWASKITLSGKLRELGSSEAAAESAFTTGAGFSTFDLVPYNLLKNARFDSGLAHWAASGVTVVDGKGTGDYAARFEGSGVRWIEQTVAPDNRDTYALSMRVDVSEAGVVPNIQAIATVFYEDGSSDSIPVELA